MLPIAHYMVLSLALLTIGIVGVVTRRNAVIVLMSIELMLNAVNVNLIAFSRLHGSVSGQVFAVFVLAVAAIEAVVGVGIVLIMVRNRQTLRVDEMDSLKW